MFRRCGVKIGFVLLLATQTAAALDLESQRELFKEAWQAAERGDIEAARGYQTELADYPLYPDLNGMLIRTTINRQHPDTIKSFLYSYPDLPISAEVKQRWLSLLANQDHWQAFLEQYALPPKPGSNKTLACHAVHAHIATGQRPVSAALGLWRVGYSQPNACDPVFEWLDEQGKLTERERRARMAQAIEARQFGLAAYLARPLSDADLERVRLWQKTQADPAKQLEEALSWSDTAGHRAVIRYGLERLSRNEPLETNELWQALDPRFEFSAADRIRIEREIALWAARIHLAEAQDLLDALPRNARTARTTQWQIRTALWNGDWARVKKFVAALPESQRQQEGWRYWDARAREQVGRLKSAGKIYRSLADTRHYYGFLAADRLGQPYVFQHVATQDNAKIQAALEERPAFQRAREFYMVGLYGRGRTEWTRATKSLKRHDLEQAALLANRWGWTSRAIWSAGKAGVRNDLELRFPLGYRDSIERYAEKAGLPSDWVFGTVRSESLFMPDVVSPAGALGLMQLIPTTGRMVARQNEVPYRNRYSLLDPDTNLALGTAYLASLYERFGGAVQATAGYNAGPHRVDIWLPEDRVIPADVWVDTIPFLETRDFVHSVMAARVVFGWRETGEATPLTDLMPPVEPVPVRVAQISPPQ